MRSPLPRWFDVKQGHQFRPRTQIARADTVTGRKGVPLTGSKRGYADALRRAIAR